MRIQFLVPALVISAFSFNTAAAPCEENFTSTGNFISGATYKTYAELPTVPSTTAYEGALADITKTASWKILQQDKAQGAIQAVQADSYKKGKSIPLNISVEASGSGSKVTMSYVTPAGTLSPESAIKSQFCQTIQAAASGTVSPLNETVSGKGQAKVIEALNTEYVKNGLPCVAEICLGDGLAELKKIKWDKAYKSLMTKESSALVEKMYRGKLVSSAPYLWKPINGYGEFDNKALVNLSEVIADCGNMTELHGGFTTSSGNPTQVAIKLLPSFSDSSFHKWTVVSISRQFPKAVSREQQLAISNDLSQRYGSFDSLKLLGKKAESYVPNYSGGMGRMKLDLEISDIRNRQLLHPACGGSSKVIID